MNTDKKHYDYYFTTKGFAFSRCTSNIVMLGLYNVMHNNVMQGLGTIKRAQDRTTVNSCFLNVFVWGQIFT